MIKVVPETRLLLENLMVRESIPRICGVAPSFSLSLVSSDHYSPPTRGCSRLGHRLACQQSVFPAYAGLFPTGTPLGMSTICIPCVRGVVPATAVSSTPTTSFPRVRGVVPKLSSLVKRILSFSPHTWGFSESLLWGLLGSWFPRTRGVVPRI